MFEFNPFVANCFAASRNAICFPLNVTYSGLGGQWPQIEVTIAHRQPRTILGRVTEVTFCSKFEFDPFVANCFAASRNAICFPLNVTYSSSIPNCIWQP